MIAGSLFVLRVPIDVSQVADFNPGCKISVLVWNRHGYHQRLVTFETQGTVEVTFELERAPESLQVALGPASATPSDLQHLQTPLVTVPPSAWQVSAEVKLPPIQVPPCVKLIAPDATCCRASADWTLVDHFFRNASAFLQIGNNANPSRGLSGTSASQQLRV